VSDTHGPGVRVPPPVLVGAAILAGWALSWLLPLPVAPGVPGLGNAVIALALGLMLWAVVVMLRAGTDPRPDRPDSALLEAGPFRFSRNPIYLGFLLAAAGLALRSGELWSWLAVAAIYIVLARHVIAREEAYLAARFGAAYDTYRARVRRWL
jgi:protein-S-isoprenylcysteine O-methyltransferase Ste14